MALSTYQKVFDDRKRRVRSLWKRNDHFYARLVIVNESTGHKATKRIRLEKARTFAEARTALRDLQKDRREQNLPMPTAAQAEGLLGGFLLGFAGLSLVIFRRSFKNV